MNTITQFYLGKASYIAFDEQGNRVDLDLDYWNNTYKVTPAHQELEEYAAKLLAKKHKVNFIYKMQEELQSDANQH